MRLPSLLQFRILKEAFRALFTGPYTTKFPAVPYTPPEGYRGKPVPNEETCVGCTACSEVCPSKAIEVKDDPATKTRTILRHYDRCIFCGQCERLCLTEDGVKLTQEYDMAALDRSTLFHEQKFELILCEACGEIIGTKKHLIWLARKLGPLAYGNLPLILTAQGELKISEEIAPTEVTPPLRRPALFRILCPRCRREALLFDEYSEAR